MSAPSPTPQRAVGTPDKHTAKEALIHFATAFVFLIAGITALFLNSEKLSQGMFSEGRVVGGLHFITLGWLSISIFGALSVFTGVALGTNGVGVGLIAWIRRLWTLGAVLFPLGLIFAVSQMIIFGVFCISIALLLFTIHIVPIFATSKRGDITRAFLIIALVSLWGTWFLGAEVAMVRAGVPILPLPQGYFYAHILFAVFGWVGSTIIGVGSHLIPMFALSRETTNLPVKIALPIWAMIPVFATIGAFYPEPFIMLGFAAAGIGSIMWLFQVMLYLKGRLRKERDPGLFLAGGSTILLGLAWIVISFTDTPIAFVGLVVIGWLTLFTLGIYHRVIPFLVWFARFARNAGRGPVPKVKDLINEKIGMTTAFLALSGTVIWANGLFLHKLELVYGGSGLILIGCVLALAQIKTLIGKVILPETNLTKDGVST